MTDGTDDRLVQRLRELHPTAGLGVDFEAVRGQARRRHTRKQWGSGLVAAGLVAAVAVVTPQLLPPSGGGETMSAAGASDAQSRTQTEPSAQRETSPAQREAPPTPMVAVADGFSSTPPAVPGARGRAEVPWAQVGPGWVYAVWSPNGTDGASGAPGAPGALLLVSPTGTRYAVAEVPNTTGVTAVTGDGSRVLMATLGAQRLLLVREGVFRPLPSIDAVVVRFGSAAGDLLVSSPQSGPPTIGPVNGPASALPPGDGGTYRWPGSALGPSGTLVVSTTTGMVEVDPSSGQVRHRWSKRSNDLWCEPISWWPDQRLQARCETPQGADLRLFADSGPDQTLAGPVSSVAAWEGGFRQAWTWSGGIVLDAMRGCGIATLDRVGGSPRPLAVTLPGRPDPGRLSAAAVVGDTLYAGIDLCVQGDNHVELYAVDLRSGQVLVNLVGPQVTPGRISSVLVIP